MELLARLENLKFEVSEDRFLPKLKEYSIDDLTSGKLAEKASCILNYRNNRFGLSQWKSPKRTRTYPYARVYDTMGQQFRVTLIPFVKDEGLDGDRDFIQWDTVSLMSLMNVYVIIGYYNRAKRNGKYKNKITSQCFDYSHIRGELDHLISCKSSALHWNLSQLENPALIAQKCRESYLRISEELEVKIHSTELLDRRIKELRDDVSQFKKTSRRLAAEAQTREIQTVQPKEVTIEDKIKITIVNYLGGEYHFTADEAILDTDSLIILEKKHSKTHLFPGISDIKDGIVRLMLFTNLVDTQIDGIPFTHRSVLGLTSKRFTGYCHSEMGIEQIMASLRENRLSARRQKTILSVFEEGKQNNFLVFLMNSDHPEYQREILGID